MFYFLFGWRQACKCKKLIRRVQCRLKLLKNKRCSIVRQFRDDLAQLLRNGSEDIAFNRVEQLFKDESIVVVYDLLDHFCEFLIIHLSYIRKHKDCPNDINEALSSLIFASSRCGDLPELRVIRKLFEDRYGQRFVKVALELLPGNLVNCQIKEILSQKSVPDDVKYGLVDEIARSCLQSGHLALEYCSELQRQQANKKGEDQVPHSDIQHNPNPIGESQMQALKGMETDGEIIYMKFLVNNKKSIETTSISTRSSTFLDSPQLDSPSEFKIPGQSANLAPEERRIAAESSSESSFQYPEETIYLDDIEEFQSPVSKDRNFQDQRLFMFRQSIIPTSKTFENGYCEDHRIEEYESWNEKAYSRSSKKSVKSSGKRLSRKSAFSDIDYPMYNGEPYGNLHNFEEISREEIQKSYCGKRSNLNGEVFHKCCLENPCNFCVSDEKKDCEGPPWKQKRRIATLEGFNNFDAKEEILQNCEIYTMNQELGSTFPPQKPRRNRKTCAIRKEMEGESESLDSLCSYASLCSCSTATSQWRRNKTKTPYLRAVTMPPERPKETWNENVIRFNSFSSQQPENSNRLSSPHVHPKLPDYDELAAKFMALKKANKRC